MINNDIGRKMKTISIIVGDITKFGGTERAVTNLANLLVHKNKICIVSLYHQAAQQPHFKLNNKIEMRYLNISIPKNIVQRFFQYFKLILVLRKLNRKSKFDYILSTAHAFSFLLPLIVIFSKTKSIAAEHIARRSLPFLSKLLQRISYPFIDVIIVLSPSAKDNYFFCRNIHVIPNSLPFNPIQPSSICHKTILSVGRISYEKGSDRLIEVATLLKGKCDGWQIKVFGNGPYEKEFKNAIDRQNLGDMIELNNAVSDIQNQYLKSDIFIMTSRFEAFPMVLLEAKACGVPVVVYDCPEGPREIIQDGYDGFLIENGNAVAMVEKLLLLMSDNGLRKKIGKNAGNSVAGYKDEIIAGKWEAMFLSIV
jgi:glycosyltransferase involved in cell wall biosynthesis